MDELEKAHLTALHHEMKRQLTVVQNKLIMEAVRTFIPFTA
jgi:hypothetical protein